MQVLNLPANTCNGSVAEVVDPCTSDTLFADRCRASVVVVCANTSDGTPRLFFTKYHGTDSST